MGANVHAGSGGLLAESHWSEELSDVWNEILTPRPEGVQGGLCCRLCRAGSGVAENHTGVSSKLPGFRSEERTDESALMSWVSAHLSGLSGY